jgi:thiosulfate/3-mercaptopyruvate sulfurtransferase
MAFSTLISTADLAANLADPRWVVVDCRFYLTDAGRGRQEYLAGHVPGAVYAHLNDDLSGPVVPGRTGRHPLPSPAVAAETLGRLGVGNDTQVVAYDSSGGSMAARLWWLLRWLGHDDVAVLDGGWGAWQAEGRTVAAGSESRQTRLFTANERPHMIAAVADVATMPAGTRLVDSRTADRYRGENETIDPIAGHIPGAVNSPYGETVGADGRFLAREQLRERFNGLLEGSAVEDAVFYCGSGVSAAQNLLALAYAGLGDARLYPGSWSEWITEASRPIATGDSP